MRNIERVGRGLQSERNVHISQLAIGLQVIFNGGIMKTYVLYHKNCRDGFGAAWAAWHFFEDSAQYIACDHNGVVPAMEDNSAVFLLDFCYPKDILMSIVNRMKHVTVIDHHKTVIEDLKDFSAPTLSLYLDLEHSGAVLTWKFFQPSVEVPLALKLIEDRDLWKFEHGRHTREFGAYIDTIDKDFRLWERVIQQMSDYKSAEECLEMGKVLLKAMDNEVERQCQNSVIQKFAPVGSDRTYNVAMVNSSVFVSEVGNRLLQLHPNAGFALIYMAKTNTDTLVSLRSRTGENVDVGKIAECAGGGGHKHASGFTIKTNDFLGYVNNRI